MIISLEVKSANFIFCPIFSRESDSTIGNIRLSVSHHWSIKSGNTKIME